MAAGLGFKDFVTGEVLTAADVDGYLMQGVWVFASAAARDAAVTSPQEGNFAYLKDTNVTTYYTGSAWANLDTTGMTNPMTTTGDTIYSSSGSTPARLGIGTSGQVLTVSGGGVPSWSTPAGGGGKVLQVVQATTSTAVRVQSTTMTDSGLTVTITPTLNTSKVLILISQQIGFERNTSQASGAWRLLRGGTSIFDGAGTNNRGFFIVTGGGQSYSYGYYALNYLDSPATTSATTYKTQIKIPNTADNAAIGAQESDTTSSIIALEIGA
jgi:hypothetical protein